jgi:hypothetical protein
MPPFKVAVTLALWFVATAPAVATKIAELAPAITVTDTGTVSSALLSESATAAPVDAASFNPTVQVADAPEANVSGLQLNDVTASGKMVVMVPPAALNGSEPADGVAPSALVIAIEVVVVLGERVAVTTATTPFWIMLAFRPFVLTPARKQV